MYQEMTHRGNKVEITRRNKRVEIHEFSSSNEAFAVMAIVAESLTWVGTPFVDCADTKGPHGGIDCAMLLVRTYVDTGMLEPFDPRPYSNQWHLHQDEEKFLEIIEGQLRGQRVETPRLGDVIVYQWGRCYAHGAIVINSDEIVHAYSKSKLCHVSWMKETELNFIRGGRPRPKLFFRVRRW